MADKSTAILAKLDVERITAKVEMLALVIQTSNTAQNSSLEEAQQPLRDTATLLLADIQRDVERGGTRSGVST